MTNDQPANEAPKIEVHLLQNFAPSCLNRDDTNTPKSCVFGGVTRARVSSQSWKRAVRRSFAATHSVTTGTRTKALLSQLSERMKEGFDDARARTFLAECYAAPDKKKPDLTNVLVFAGDKELAEIAACLREGVSGKDAQKRLRDVAPSPDIALFGRMLADHPDRNTDAACQVAQAISTHAVDYETDFYTAVDDLTEARDEVGAGMLGTQGYNSACFYRYALLDVGQLAVSLKEDSALTRPTIEAFLRAFTLAIPTAKQNSHAAQNLPSLGLFVVRRQGVPVSLANAFARPIRKENKDIIGDSIRALARHRARLDDVYGLYSNATLAVFHDRDGDEELGGLSAHDVGSLEKAVQSVMAQVGDGSGQ